MRFVAAFTLLSAVCGLAAPTADPVNDVSLAKRLVYWDVHFYDQSCTDKEEVTSMGGWKGHDPPAGCLNLLVGDDGKPVHNIKLTGAKKAGFHVQIFSDQFCTNKVGDLHDDIQCFVVPEGLGVQGYKIFKV